MEKRGKHASKSEWSVELNGESTGKMPQKAYYC